MSGVAFVFGLCALSFAAGCVLTAVMLRREQPPEPTPQPAPAAPMPRFEPHFPPEDYATKPIHRNPVMGIPTALPEPDRPTPRPNLVAVPDPVSRNGKPARQDEVRRMHVVRAEPEPAGRVVGIATLAGPAEPALAAIESTEPSAGITDPDKAADLDEVDEVDEPGGTVEPGPEPAAGPEVIQVVAGPEPGGPRRAFEAARPEVNR
ncbi:hypothetical protein [Saccharothrix luteola]|uniref:hypothetical protein n=1 Tax=Saccharothrix luteola TaxID=2893018 RepID=UPI001E5A641F|nr:hypothetical protein [Saccharothrix luteola]MCC8245832.1 hypothetical protein [Saccharothrix luteola]